MVVLLTLALSWRKLIVLHWFLALCDHHSKAKHLAIAKCFINEIVHYLIRNKLITHRLNPPNEFIRVESLHS